MTARARFNGFFYTVRRAQNEYAEAAMSKTLITNARVVNEGSPQELGVVIDGQVDRSTLGQRLNFGCQR